MSSGEKAVSVRGLSKAYTIAHGEEKHITLAETLLARLKKPLRRFSTETFWALKDVSFEIAKGEVVGIIGRNGAGKSTLLKILSRITEPTAGEIDLHGRVGSLLEVGTGFHPELTGRENIYLNGAILGMSKPEIRRQFDAIVDFAGVEKFLDTAVKRYSSGMYVRLAFAVAAHLNSEILIVDEVLAVGDSEFQRKCMGKMKDITSTGGKTVLFVSHNLAAIASLCNHCLLLSSGQLAMAGETQKVLNRYLMEHPSSGEIRFDLGTRNERLLLCSCAILDATEKVSPAIAVNEPFIVRVGIVCRAPAVGLELSIRIDNASGLPIFTSNLSDCLAEPFEFKTGEYLFDIPVPAAFLAPDQYVLSRVAIHRPNVEMFDLQENSLSFEIEEVGSNMAKYKGTRFGVVLVRYPWKLVEYNAIG